ncbi:hypothetical protein VTO73DRAFT_11851 [Trametes versicolor]
MFGAVPFDSLVDSLSSIYEYFLHTHALLWIKPISCYADLPLLRLFHIHSSYLGFTWIASPLAVAALLSYRKYIPSTLIACPTHPSKRRAQSNYGTYLSFCNIYASFQPFQTASHAVLAIVRRLAWSRRRLIITRMASLVTLDLIITDFDDFSNFSGVPRTYEN